MNTRPQMRVDRRGQGSRPPASSPGGRNEVKPDEIDVGAAAVLGDLEEVDNALEARAARQFAGDVIKRNALDGIDDNVPILHRVDTADLDMRALPDAHAAGDPPLAHALAKAFGEHHGT